MSTAGTVASGCRRRARSDRRGPSTPRQLPQCRGWGQACRSDGPLALSAGEVRPPAGPREGEAAAACAMARARSRRVVSFHVCVWALRDGAGRPAVVAARDGEGETARARWQRWVAAFFLRLCWAALRGRGCVGGVRNYYSNLPLFKLIRVNNLIRNQEVPRGTPNHSKRAHEKYSYSTKFEK